MLGAELTVNIIIPGVSIGTGDANFHNLLRTVPGYQLDNNSSVFRLVGLFTYLTAESYFQSLYKIKTFFRERLKLHI